MRVHYLHSEIETLERVEILRDLRLGVYDVVVGINLLREGLDLPEVSLVAILDADKEGYLRSRHQPDPDHGPRRPPRRRAGAACTRTRSRTACSIAMEETERRREIQAAHNEANGITPQGIRKAIRDLGERLKAVAESRSGYEAGQPIPKEDIAKLVKDLERQMKEAARSMEFERAALLRDQIYELRATLSDADTPDTALAPVSRARRGERRRYRPRSPPRRRAPAPRGPRAARRATAAGAVAARFSSRSGGKPPDPRRRSHS